MMLAFVVEVEVEKWSTERIKTLPVDVVWVTDNPGFEQPLELGMTDGRRQ